jgi:hypothetical protein
MPAADLFVSARQGKVCSPIVTGHLAADPYASSMYHTRHANPGLPRLIREYEGSEAISLIQTEAARDCFITLFLAMTGIASLTRLSLARGVQFLHGGIQVAANDIRQHPDRSRNCCIDGRTFLS